MGGEGINKLHHYVQLDVAWSHGVLQLLPSNKSTPGPDPGHVTPVLPVYNSHQAQLLPCQHTQVSEKTAELT